MVAFNFCDSLYRILSNITKKDRNNVVNGDSTLILETLKTIIEKTWDLIESFHCKKRIFEPTKKEKCLDNILIKLDVKHKVQIWDAAMRDHSAITISLLLEIRNKPVVEI